MKLTVLIEKDEESGTYTGTCLEVSGGIGQGDTPELCKNDTMEAARLILEYKMEQAEHLRESGSADIMIGNVEYASVARKGKTFCITSKNMDVSLFEKGETTRSTSIRSMKKLRLSRGIKKSTN